MFTSSVLSLVTPSLVMVTTGDLLGAFLQDGALLRGRPLRWPELHDVRSEHEDD